LYQAFTGFINGEITVWALAVIVIITVLKSYKEIFQAFIDFKANKFKKLESAINCDWVSDDKKAIFKDELEQLHIAEASGIKCAVEVRNELLDIYSRGQGRIRLSHFQRAAGLVKLENEVLVHSTNKLQRGWYYIELITGIVLWGITIPIICISAYATLSSGSEFPTNILLLLLMAAVLVYDGGKVISLRHVLNESQSVRARTKSKELKAAA
tara:strand:+ start:4750 stop:5385 length:636 start_codon:yes stop_codon:yes gene_type:complete